jgi:hypothetical protein
MQLLEVYSVKYEKNQLHSLRVTITSQLTALYILTIWRLTANLVVVPHR